MKRREEIQEFLGDFNGLLGELVDELDDPRLSEAYKDVQKNVAQADAELESGVHDDYFERKGALHDLEMEGYRRARKDYDEGRGT